MEMKSYTNVVSLFRLREDSVFNSLNDAVEVFEDDSSVDVILNTDHHRVDVIFKEDVTVADCECIYLGINQVRPIGVLMMTNRNDLFAKYEQNYIKVSRLQNKMFKQSAKFNKAKRKLEKALEKLA
jgi:hypothetical protein